MPGFEAIYKQTITLFNRKKVGDDVFWYPFIMKPVHLIMDKSIIISTYGEQSQDNARVHIQYVKNGSDAIVGGKTYLMPKEWERSGNPSINFTLGFGDDFDFIMEGEYTEESLSAVASNKDLEVSIDEDQWKKSSLASTGIYVFEFDGDVWNYFEVEADLTAFGIMVIGEAVEGDKITVRYVSSEGPINDDDYHNGFYNYMNKNYDNVFAITTVSKFNLLPHFEVGAR